jgi:hypothetical protein
MSQIVNTKGEILIQASSDKEEAMSIEINLSEALIRKLPIIMMYLPIEEKNFMFCNN